MELSIQVSLKTCHVSSKVLGQARTPHLPEILFKNNFHVAHIYNHLFFSSYHMTLISLTICPTLLFSSCLDLLPVVSSYRHRPVDR